MIRVTQGILTLAVFTAYSTVQSRDFIHSKLVSKSLFQSSWNGLFCKNLHITMRSDFIINLSKQSCAAIIYLQFSIAEH